MAIIPCRPKWKGTMTDRQRFNNQMHYRPVDRCFNMEFGYWQENYEQWPIFTQNHIRHEWEANQFFNFDDIRCVWGNSWIHPGFPDTVVSETATTKTLMNGDGLLAEVPFRTISRPALSRRMTGRSARLSGSASMIRGARSTSRI